MTVRSPLRISLWSGPRNVSTAILYAFAQRKDTRVFDEPLYAHYLANSDAHTFHPGADDILRSQENNGQKVVDEIFLGETSWPVLFFKNMAHHLVKLDWKFLHTLKNIILTRDPRDMLLSYSKTISKFTLNDTGYPQLKRICETLAEFGETPLVLDSRTLLEDPRAVLGKLCQTIGLEFDSAMLSWEVGPKPFEGIWAPHWYHNIHKSTTFEPYHPKKEPFPDHLRPLLEECRPLHDYLIQFSFV